MADDIYVIHITRKCNLDCAYCYEKDKRDYNFSIEEIDALIESISPDLIKANHPKVELLGGEPLLYIEGIRYALERVYRLNPNTKFLITTNGTVYHQELVNLLNQYQVKLYISLDGNKFMHNANRVFKHSRKGSFDKIVENTKLYLKELGLMPCLSMTLNKYTMPFLYDGLKYFYTIGAYEVSIGIVAQDMTEDNQKIIIQQARLFKADRVVYYAMNIPVLKKQDLSLYVLSEQQDMLEHKQVMKSDEMSDEIKRVYRKHFFFQEVRDAIAAEEDKHE